MSHVFLSYVREDQEIALSLFRDLTASGLDVWMDRDRIKPSQRWKDAIRKAIREGAAFIACFSEAYLRRRKKSYFNEELTLAIEELRLRPQDQIWFIPVLLSPSSIPDRSIGAGERLSDLHGVALYENWNEGVQQIVAAVMAAGIQLPTVEAGTEIPEDIEQLFQHDDPEMNEQMVALRNLPLTTYWVRSVQVEKVSALFTEKLLELLTADDGAHPLEQAMVGLSFSLFCRAIEQTRSLDCTFITLLNRVINEEAIPPNRKLFALQAILRCGSQRCQGGIGVFGLPGIFADGPERARFRPLVGFLLYTLFESPDPSIPIEVFSRLWTSGSNSERHDIARRIVEAANKNPQGEARLIAQQLEAISDATDEELIISTFRAISDGIRSGREGEGVGEDLEVYKIRDARSLIEAAIVATRIGDFKYIEEWVKLSDRHYRLGYP